MSKIVGIDLGTTFSAIAYLNDLGKPEIAPNFENNQRILPSVVYINGENKKVQVYPTPENVNKIQYKDLMNNCFSFKYKKLDCNKVEEKNLKNIPLQY